MRQKSTVSSLEQHNQFEGTKEDIELQKKLIKENWKKGEKEGQSKFRVDKVTGNSAKKGVV